MAAANRNPFITQLRVIASAPKVAAIVGRAMFTEVPIKGVKKEAILATNNAMILRPSF
jgi:hypothetical protein